MNRPPAFRAEIDSVFNVCIVFFKVYPPAARTDMKAVSFSASNWNIYIPVPGQDYIPAHFGPVFKRNYKEQMISPSQVCHFVINGLMILNQKQVLRCFTAATAAEENLNFLYNCFHLVFRGRIGVKRLFFKTKTLVCTLERMFFVNKDRWYYQWLILLTALEEEFKSFTEVLSSKQT